LSIPRIPDPAQLVIGILAADEVKFRSALTDLCRSFGEIQQILGPLKFDFTDYYRRELGHEIRRWLVVFKDLVDRAGLASIKLLTNDIENAYSIDGKRQFNLDPGLLTLENFVLATGKNRAHRVYLSDGIFADLTLVFRKGSYRPLDWTYPDYADKELIEILNRIREHYKCRPADPQI
jgi:hypothetical protein